MTIAGGIDENHAANAAAQALDGDGASAGGKGPMGMSNTAADPGLRPRVLKPYRSEDAHSFFHRHRRALMAALIVYCLFTGFIFGALAPYMMTVFAAPLLVMAMLAIWAMPTSVRAPDRTLERLYFAFVVSLIIWPNYLAVALPGLPWITITRLVGLPLVLVLLTCLSVSPDFRQRLGDALKSARVIAVLMAAFALIQGLSIAISADKGLSVQKFIADQTSWTAIFFVSVYVFLKPGRVVLWAALVWAMAVAVSLIALWEFKTEHVPWAGHIPSFLKIEDETVNRILAGSTREGQYYRAQSTFSTPLGFAEYLALATPFVLQFITGQYRPAVRVAAVLTVPLIIVAVLDTDSRLGVIGVFVSFLLYVLLWGAIRWKREPSSIVGPTIVLAFPAAFAVIFAATIVVGRIRNKVWGAGQYDASNHGRMEQLASGLPMVLRNPIGHGIGMGAQTLDYHQPGGLLTIDNYYLLIALEYGLAGFVAFYGLLALGIVRAVKESFTPVAAKGEFGFFLPMAIAQMNFFLIKSIFSNDDNHPMVFMMLGMVAALSFRALRAPEQMAPPAA